MKKIFFAILTAAFFIISCKEPRTSSATQKNLEAARAIDRAFVTGDVKAIDSFVSDDFIDHTDRGDMKGRDSLKAMVKFVHENMKGMKTETIRQLADDEYVMSWMHWTGTSNGTGGMPNGPFDMKAIEVARYKDGKAVEHWTFMEIQEMMKMMPPPSNLPDMEIKDKTDTLKAK